MFNAKDLLDVLLKGAQPGAASQGQSPGGLGGLGGLGDILGQVLGGGQSGRGAPQAGSAGGNGGGGLGDILGQVLGGSRTNAGTGDGGGAQPGGGLGDIFAQIQKQMGGAQGSGSGGGGLTDVLGQIFGQATSGVKEGAGKVDEATGASDKIREAIAQATGKSPEEVMAQIQEWIRSNPGTAAAGAGGLGAVILGTQAGRSLAGSAAKLGALAMIGGLAYKALQNYQQGRPLITGAGTRQTLSAAPSGTGFEPDAISNESATLYIRAMIAAAAADGRIDATEQQRILGGLQQAGAGDESHAFLQKEISNPATVDDLAAAVSNDAEAAQVYTAARIAIDPDTDEENEFLSNLAEKLGIDDALAKHIDATARTAA